MIVFDASALLAIIRDEPGAHVATSYLADAVISAVNLGEVAHVQMRKLRTIAEVMEVFDELAVPVIDVDADQAIEAAEIRIALKSHGLSQADCICLVLAKRHNALALTADRKWAEIAEQTGVKVKLIR